MNILTKISVVVLVLLIAIFSPIVIQVATQWPNYKDYYQTSQARNAKLEQECRVLQVIVQRLQAENAGEKNRAQSAVATAAAETGGLAQKLDEEKARAAALEARLTSMDLTVSKFQTDLKANNDRNVQLVSDLNSARKEINDRMEELRQVTAKLQRAGLDAEGYKAQVDFLHDQLAQAEDKIKTLEETVRQGGGLKKTGEAAAPVVPDGAIHGTLTAVKGNIASVNVGSAKGVKVNMAATVSRGAEYVCQLQITNVDTNEAAGVIVRKKLDPAAGDKIEISSER